MAVVVVSLLGARAAHAADAPPPCLLGPADDPFPICFDTGNRLVLQLAYGGTGGAIELRHVVQTEDNDISWRLEHRLAAAGTDGTTWRGALYRGRFMRHSRDGHIVLPTSPPRKLFLPFDIGAEADVGRFEITPGAPRVRLGMVRAALLLDVARNDDREDPFLRRLAFGVAARWDLEAPDLGRPFSDAEHFAAPFSMGVAELHLESRDGLTVFDASVEAGERWSSQTGWGGALVAQTSLERVVVAFNDRPLSLYAASGWEAPGRGAWVTAGLRFALVGWRPTRPGR